MTPALPDGYRLVRVPLSRNDEFREVDHLAFGYEPDPETVAQVPDYIEWDRAAGVEAPDGSLAAVHASFAFALPVPGAAPVECAGLTWVGTRPDQRRRGLLSAMIADHFAHCQERGEPVSALYAAESAIYGRFGYGSAADDLRVTIQRGAALRDVQGSEELVVRFAKLDAGAHGELVERVHAAAGQGRPGWIRRSTDALRGTALADPPAWRQGGEPLRLASVHDADGEPRAYALLRRKEEWVDNVPKTKVVVRESAAVDAAAAHRLWSFLLDMDLTASVQSGPLPVDDRVRSLLVDARDTAPKITDNVWVRLVDVPAALAARRYSSPLDVVLDVADSRLPANAGRWRLTTGEVGPDGAYDVQVTRTQDDADLALDVRELGAAYLGGRSLAAFADAGLVQERRPGALHAASAAFAWPLAPLCSWMF